MAAKPSTRFPFINLAKALERAESIFNDDKRGNGMKIPTAFAAWGYSDKSSGGFQTVSALKGYGLLADDGAKADRGVRLTDAARRYFMTEIEEEHAALRTEFALQPNLMRHLYERWDGHPPSDPVARSYLKTEIGLNDQSARAALGVYKDNLSFVSDKGSAMNSDEAFDRDRDAEVEDREERVVGHLHRQVAPATLQLMAALPEAVMGPSFNVVPTAGGYVIQMGGTVATKAHVDEVVTMLTALKVSLPEGKKEEPTPQ